MFQSLWFCVAFMTSFFIGAASLVVFTVFACSFHSMTSSDDVLVVVTFWYKRLAVILLVRMEYFMVFQALKLQRLPGAPAKPMEKQEVFKCSPPKNLVFRYQKPGF